MGDGQGWVLGTPPCLQISVKQNKPLKDLRLGCALEITRKLPSSRSLLMLRRLENRGWGWESGKAGKVGKAGKGAPAEVAGGCAWSGHWTIGCPQRPVRAKASATVGKNSIKSNST